MGEGSLITIPAAESSKPPPHPPSVPHSTITRCLSQENSTTFEYSSLTTYLNITGRDDKEYFCNFTLAPNSISKNKLQLTGFTALHMTSAVTVVKLLHTTIAHNTRHITAIWYFTKASSTTPLLIFSCTLLL